MGMMPSHGLRFPGLSAVGSSAANLAAGLATAAGAAPVTALVGAYPVNSPEFAGTGETQFANALASGHKSLFLPGGLALATTTAKTVPAGVRLELRKGSSITVTGTNINALVVGGDDVEICGEGSIVCCGSSASYGNYNGAAVSTSTSRARVRISGITISNHRGWGIVGVDPVGWMIEKVRFTAANAPATPDQTTMFADVGLIGGAQVCEIRRCNFDSGQAFPVLIQTVANVAASVLFNVVQDNYVNGALGHGIQLYGQNLQNSTGTQIQGTGQDIFYGNLIKNNRVNGTLGSLLWTTGANHPYGIGIYVQGGTGTIVSGNTVVGACLNTDTETLAPAGIGFVNCRYWTCSNNVVIGSTWYGFYYQNANDGGVVGEVANSFGNTARGCTKAGFKIISMADIISTGDVAMLNTTYGWELRDANAKGVYRFRSCTAQKNTLDGFSTIGTAITKVMYDGCDATNNGQHGFSFSNSTVSRIFVTNCQSVGNTSRGFSVGTGMTIDAWWGNHALSNGTAYLLGTSGTSTALPAEGQHYGTATPEAAIMAAIGCRFVDTTNGNMYLKRTGAGTNTGWVLVTAA